MTNNETKSSGPECCKESICNVEAVLSIDDRGQFVLPKDLREKAGIKGGDKFALISWKKDDKIHCFSLLRSEDLGNYVKGFLNNVDFIKSSD